MSAQAKKEEVLLPAPIVQGGMALTPMDMLDRAITQGAGIEVLEKAAEQVASRLTSLPDGPPARHGASFAA